MSDLILGVAVVVLVAAITLAGGIRLGMLLARPLDRYAWKAEDAAGESADADTDPDPVATAGQAGRPDREAVVADTGLQIAEPAARASGSQAPATGPDRGLETTRRPTGTGEQRTGAR